MSLVNRVAEYRALLQLTQSELAQKIHITRQALGLIESGKVSPSTLVAIRLARVFQVNVETLFYEDGDENSIFHPTIGSTDEEIRPGDRVILADVDGQTIVRLANAMNSSRVLAAPTAAVVKSISSSGAVNLSSPCGETVPLCFVLAGCDMGLGLLTEHLDRRFARPRTPSVWVAADNRQAVGQLKSGLAHVASVHIPVTEGPTLLPEPSIRSIHFARWEVGWMVKRGNPLGFREVDQLRNGTIRMVNRPLGSGVRTLFDSLLQSASIPHSQVAQYDFAVSSHRQVAEAVSYSAADVGIGVAAAASQYHLDFIPIREEQSLLWIPEHRMAMPEVQQLLDALHSDLFRWDLTRYGPCDVSQTGNEVYL